MKSGELGCIACKRTSFESYLNSGLQLQADDLQLLWCDVRLLIFVVLTNSAFPI